jgi:uncharacterized Zn finger protein
MTQARLARRLPCPTCGGFISRVIASRDERRLRQCQAQECGTIWGTREQFDRLYPKDARSLPRTDARKTHI